MKLLTGLVFCSLVLSVSSRSFFSFLGEAFDAMPERISRDSQAVVRRTRWPIRLPINGAGVAETPITSDLLACLRNTELPLHSALRRPGYEALGAGIQS
ncbi:serum amyloid A-2 protein isoform c preproprotein [Homo sapiens]|uniref:serum amyloid A-2 protein isoform c preproprotein n=2 Tax=Homo sapiens TaxID=9606 RepID=UPI0015DEE52A|nr:serum amyloid A-2 protein isoform c preproprotein [Homo sapiens]